MNLGRHDRCRHVFIIMERVKSFHYLGNVISYENEVGVDNKLNNYLKITATIRSEHTKKGKKTLQCTDSSSFVTR